MSFRRDSKKAKQWRDWVSKNQDHLIDCGIPPIIYEKENNWWDFINHCYYSPDGVTPLIDVDDMPNDQALKFCLFLEAEETSEEHKSSTLNRLQYLLGRGIHARPLFLDDISE